MTGAEVLERLDSLGVILEIAENKLRLMPGSLVPPDIVEEVRQHKVEIINILTQKVSVDKPIIWETGNIPQIHSLLVIRQAELEVAKSKLAGNDRIDWYVNNRIMDLEIKIADLKLWLTKAMKQREDAI